MLAAAAEEGGGRAGGQRAAGALHDDQAPGAQADGRVEQDGGLAEAGRAVVVVEQGVITEVRAQGRDPQQAVSQLPCDQAEPSCCQIRVVRARRTPNTSASTRLPPSAAARTVPP